MKGLMNSINSNIKRDQPTTSIIRELEAALDWNRLADCHCHGPRCTPAPGEGGPLDRWDGAARWQRAFAVARARLHRLALWWGGNGGTPGQLTLPGFGQDSIDTLAPAPGGSAQRDPHRRAGDGTLPPQKVGRSTRRVGKDRS